MKRKFKKLPIGISDFQKLIEQDFYYFDKTLLIKELLDTGSEVALIVRPRRFGKTVNLSMLHYFFEKSEQSQARLFNNLAIGRLPHYMKHQGLYPVIFMSLREVKGATWHKSYEIIRNQIAAEFRRHDSLLENAVLDAGQKRRFKAVIDGTADENEYASSLKNLSFWLHQHHGIKPIILIDEYDTPVHEAFMSGYYHESIEFMRAFLGSGLKDNTSLSFAVVTGILRIAKESIFSDLNNLDVCTVLHNLYADKFGLLEGEVVRALDEYGFSNQIESIRRWYNGYHIGAQTTVYNPWSIINLLHHEGKEGPYWVNTSSNTLIRKLIETGDDEIKSLFEQLIAGHPIRKEIFENIVFRDVEKRADAVWSFLLLAGYLTYDNFAIESRHPIADLKIPNDEVLYFYEAAITEWIKGSPASAGYTRMLTALDRGDADSFVTLFEEFVTEAFSYFDVSGNKPELFYHAFVLGLLAGLHSTHEIRSNRESGHGRYDVIVFPRDTRKTGFIFEFKKVDQKHHETLEQAVAAAMQQIESRHYKRELEARGISKIVEIGVAFEGKKMLIRTHTLSEI